MCKSKEQRAGSMEPTKSSRKASKSQEPKAKGESPLAPCSFAPCSLLSISSSKV